MSTYMYRLKVLEKDGLDIKLRVRIVYYDLSDTPDESCREFFLNQLAQQAEGYDTRPNAPLWDALFPPEKEYDSEEEEEADEEIAEEGQLSELDFRERMAPTYISRVVRLESHNFPVKDTPPFNGENWTSEQWQNNRDQLPYTDYLVTVTDERWIEHLTPGEEWGTTDEEGIDY